MTGEELTLREALEVIQALNTDRGLLLGSRNHWRDTAARLSTLLVIVASLLWLYVAGDLSMGFFRHLSVLAISGLSAGLAMCTGILGLTVLWWRLVRHPGEVPPQDAEPQE